MQTTFSQETLPLDARQVRIRELLRLPVSSGLSRTLAAIDMLAGEDAHAAVPRGRLATELEVAPSTISRRCAQLVDLGLLRRISIGPQAAWAIEWARVLDGIEAPAAKSTESYDVAGAGPAEIGTEEAGRDVPEIGCGQLGAETFGAGQAGTAWPSVALRSVRAVVLVLLAVPCWVARRVLAVESWMLECNRASRAGRGDERGAAGVPGPCGPVTVSRRRRYGRQTLALPFTRDFAVGGCAASVQGRDAEVVHTPQLATSDSKEIAASSSGEKKRFVSIDWDGCKTPAGAVTQFQKLIGEGLLSPEDADQWQMFLHAVRRRAGGEPLRDEKAIRSPAAYVARVVVDGTWRKDVRRVDRAWFEEEVDRAQRRAVGAAVGVADVGEPQPRELNSFGQVLQARMRRKG